jgi:hypothetical protein
MSAQIHACSLAEPQLTAVTDPSVLDLGPSRAEAAQREALLSSVADSALLPHAGRAAPLMSMLMASSDSIRRRRQTGRHDEGSVRARRRDYLCGFSSRPGRSCGSAARWQRESFRQRRCGSDSSRW